MNNKELRLDDLQLDDLKMYQYKDGYNFTSDSVIVANFVKTTKKDVCVEIGTGSGVISILVNYKNKPQKIYAFELQKIYADLAQKNVEFNNMQDSIMVVNSDIVNFDKFLTKPVDVVFCNPPYYKDGVCKKSEDEDIAKCKHESFLPLDILMKTVSKMLKFGGKFYFVYPACRLDEIMVELNKNNLQPKKIFFAQPTINKNANTVYVECIKGGKNGVNILPTLITNSLDGTYVQTIQKLYRDV